MKDTSLFHVIFTEMTAAYLNKEIAYSNQITYFDNTIIIFLVYLIGYHSITDER